MRTVENWNNLTTEQKIEEWHVFRNEIKTLNKNEQLEKIAKYWSTAPLGSRSIDFYTPSTWPDPWEILYYGRFCENSISLLMYYTFRLINTDAKCEIWLIDNSKERYIVPVVEDNYLLNYEIGSVNIWQDLKDTVRIIEKFSNDDIHQVS